jgi:hypothetical protein
MQARYIFDPPKTRLTADGIVEDVPEPAEDAAHADEAEAMVPLADAGSGTAIREATVPAGADANGETPVPASLLPNETAR